VSKYEKDNHLAQKVEIAHSQQCQDTSLAFAPPEHMHGWTKPAMNFKDLKFEIHLSQ
jgi:hypothetical protein